MEFVQDIGNIVIHKVDKHVVKNVEKTYLKYTYDPEGEVDLSETLTGVSFFFLRWNFLTLVCSLPRSKKKETNRKKKA